MTGLTWLHLSDWHQAEKKFNREVVCDALIRDIKNRGEISPHLSKIDFIIFSGDAANSGQADEYKKAIEDLFKPILEACNLSSDRLFIVPGNHDLDRDLIPVSLSKPLTSNEEVETWWSTDKKRAQLNQPFQEFYRFLTNCTGQSCPEYCCTCEFEVGGKKIALIGINSAWMCARHKDESGEFSDQGYLCIGEPQIYGSLEKISNSDVKIAILHHPLDWLTSFDLGRVEVHLKRKCNFILHGHAHKPGAIALKDNFGYYITIPAGACYERSMPSDSGYAYSYNYVHLDFDTDKGVVFLRRWSDLNRVWRKDDETCPPKGEFGPFSISGLDKAPNPHQIPPPPKEFKGREDEIRDIISNFEKGATITGLRGMGGIGKTALALVLADRLKKQFPDGQIFIDMRGTSVKAELPPITPVDAMAQVIRAYNPVDRLPENPVELRGLYLSILTGKRILLLLDNAANGEQVEPLLPPEGCSVLITSRIKFTFPGLVEKDLNILPSDKARELLLEIAPRIADRAEELAKLCGYLPLALRNAAKALAEKQDLSVSEYERRLKEKVARLELVKASFSLSYELLTPRRKQQWRRLSVFPEDFDRNAAIAVLKMAPGPSAEALSDLVRWSLVDFIPFPDSEGGRYRLHDLARLFAESCLEPGELVDAQKKHSEYYQKVLSEADKLYKRGEENLLAGLELFDREWANIKVGQAWTKSMVRISKKLIKSDRKFVLEMANYYANDGADILSLRLNPRDEIIWLENGLTAAEIMVNRGAEGSHLNNIAIAYSELGNARNAINYYEQALTIFRKIGNKKNEGRCLGNLGDTYSDLCESRKAIEYCEQALLISREIEDKMSEGNNLGNLGVAYFELGETGKAIEYFEQSLLISQEIGNKRNEGSQLCNLGRAYFSQGETSKAIEYYERALAIAHEIEDRKNVGETLCNIGKAYADLNEPGKSIEFCTQSLDIVRRIEYHRIEGESLCNFGKVYADLGETFKAIDYCDQALEIFQKMEYRRGEGDALFNKSLALDKLGQQQNAIDSAKAALTIFEQIESPQAEKVRQKLTEWQGSSPQEN